MSERASVAAQQPTKEAHVTGNPRRNGGTNGLLHRLARTPPGNPRRSRPPPPRPAHSLIGYAELRPLVLAAAAGLAAPAAACAVPAVAAWKPRARPPLVRAACEWWGMEGRGGREGGR